MGAAASVVPTKSRKRYNTALSGEIFNFVCQDQEDRKSESHVLVYRTRRQGYYLDIETYKPHIIAMLQEGKAKVSYNALYAEHHRPCSYTSLTRELQDLRVLVQRRDYSPFKEYVVSVELDLICTNGKTVKAAVDLMNLRLTKKISQYFLIDQEEHQDLRVYCNKRIAVYNNKSVCCNAECPEIITANTAARYVNAAYTCSCGVMQCIACAVDYSLHEGKSCAEYKYNKHNPFNTKEMIELAMKGVIQPCPNCMNICELMDGCNKVVCRICGAYWCWLCGVGDLRELFGDPYTHYSTGRSKSGVDYKCIVSDYFGKNNEAITSRMIHLIGLEKIRKYIPSFTEPNYAHRDKHMALMKLPFVVKK
jgi:hypothetical protein